MHLNILQSAMYCWKYISQEQFYKLAYELSDISLENNKDPKPQIQYFIAIKGCPKDFLMTLKFETCSIQISSNWNCASETCHWKMGSVGSIFLKNSSINFNTKTRTKEENLLRERNSVRTSLRNKGASSLSLHQRSVLLVF